MELSAEQKAQLEEQKKQCPFCRIIAGEIPTQKVYEDDKIVAILDINPLKKGHVLILPKEHYPILALMPQDEMHHLFSLIPEFEQHLRKAMLATHTSIFIANGAAAGQQAGHFMIHMVPSDGPIEKFNPPEQEQDQDAYNELQEVLANNLPIMMRKNAKAYPLESQTEESTEDNSRKLAEILEQNPDIKQMVIENPDAVLAGLDDNPSLKPLFDGVDVHALSKRLREQQQVQPAPEPVESEVIPRAVDLSDQQLRSYLKEREKLQDFLLNDHKTLAVAVDQQPKLQEFFSDTSIEEVAKRLQPAPDSLEDLADGSQ